jgi:hypothetical protein
VPESIRIRPRSRLVLAGAALLLACGDRSAPTAAPPFTPPPPPEIGRFPTLQIATTAGAPIASRETYVTGSWRLMNADSVVEQQGTLDIRGRGNTTWLIMPKKPYRVRLTAAAPLLGMPSNRHWALLANYADKTLVRNDLVLDLGRRLGFAWTPRSGFVHLELNGRYDGLYQLTEHIRVDPQRVNVPELRVGDTSAAMVSGGYLLEVDELRGEAFCWDAPRSAMPLCAKSPETLLDAAWAPQRAYITGYVRDLEEALFGPAFTDPVRGYAQYLDVPSAVDYLLLNELVRNVDGNLRRSTYLTKPRGGKLTFGPLWDYDIALGNVNYDNGDRTDGWHILPAPWFARLWQDPAFQQRVKLRWQQIRGDGTLTGWRAHAMRRWDYMQDGQRRNFTRWPILNTWVWPNRVVTGSYDGEVAAMLAWWDARVSWMDAQLRL